VFKVVVCVRVFVLDSENGRPIQKLMLCAARGLAVKMLNYYDGQAENVMSLRVFISGNNIVLILIAKLNLRILK
jgi:hypothetical protein